jgi:hypothetical protein
MWTRPAGMSQPPDPEKSAVSKTAAVVGAEEQV